MSVTSLLSRAAGLQYRLLERMRHADAFRAAREFGTAPDFQALRGHHFCLLITFKRSGEPVPTPVLFGLADGRLYFRTESNVGKVKRIRNDPHVRVGPCDPRAKPLGPLTEGRARLLPAAEEQAAYAALKTNYTFSQRLGEAALDRLPLEIGYVQVVPAAWEAA